MNKNPYLNSLTDIQYTDEPCGLLVRACVGKLIDMVHTSINPNWRLYLIKHIKCNKYGHHVACGTLYAPNGYVTEEHELKISGFVSLVPIDLDLE